MCRAEPPYGAADHQRSRSHSPGYCGSTASIDLVDDEASRFGSVRLLAAKLFHVVLGLKDLFEQPDVASFVFFRGHVLEPGR